MLPLQFTQMENSMVGIQVHPSYYTIIYLISISSICLSFYGYIYIQICTHTHSVQQVLIHFLTCYFYSPLPFKKWEIVLDHRHIGNAIIGRIHLQAKTMWRRENVFHEVSTSRCIKLKCLFLFMVSFLTVVWQIAARSLKIGADQGHKLLRECTGTYDEQNDNEKDNGTAIFHLSIIYVPI